MKELAAERRNSYRRSTQQLTKLVSSREVSRDGAFCFVFGRNCVLKDEANLVSGVPAISKIFAAQDGSENESISFPFREALNCVRMFIGPDYFDAVRVRKYE